MENKKLLVDTLELIHKLDEAAERYKGRDEHGELLTDDTFMDEMVEDGIACKLQFVGKYLTRTSGPALESDCGHSVSRFL